MPTIINYSLYSVAVFFQRFFNLFVVVLSTLFLFVHSFSPQTDTLIPYSRILSTAKGWIFRLSYEYMFTFIFAFSFFRSVFAFFSHETSAAVVVFVVWRLLPRDFYSFTPNLILYSRMVYNTTGTVVVFTELFSFFLICLA